MVAGVSKETPREKELCQSLKGVYHLRPAGNRTLMVPFVSSPFEGHKSVGAVAGVPPWESVYLTCLTSSIQVSSGRLAYLDHDSFIVNSKASSPH